jgi:hypothetical protein
MIIYRLNLFLLLCFLSSLNVISSRADEAPVTWDSLKALDELAEKCEVLCESKNIVELRSIADAVKKAADAVASDTIPSNAKEPDQIKILQSDLKSLADQITDPLPRDEEELTTLMAALHPIVEKLMESSGMPHVHEDDGDETGAK